MHLYNHHDLTEVKFNMHTLRNTFPFDALTYTVPRNQVFIINIRMFGYGFRTYCSYMYLICTLEMKMSHRIEMICQHICLTYMYFNRSFYSTLRKLLSIIIGIWLFFPPNILQRNPYCHWRHDCTEYRSNLCNLSQINQKELSLRMT